MLGARNRKLNKTVSALNELKKRRNTQLRRSPEHSLSRGGHYGSISTPDLSQAGPCVILLYVVSIFRKSGAEQGSHKCVLVE